MYLQISVLKLVSDYIERLSVGLRDIVEVLVKKVFGKPVEPTQRPVFRAIELRAYALLPVGIWVPHAAKIDSRFVQLQVQIGVEKERDLVKSEYASRYAAFTFSMAIE